MVGVEERGGELDGMDSRYGGRTLIHDVPIRYNKMIILSFVSNKFCFVTEYVVDFGQGLVRY